MNSMSYSRWLRTGLLRITAIVLLMGRAIYEYLHSHLYRNCKPKHLAAKPMQKRALLEEEFWFLMLEVQSLLS